MKRFLVLGWLVINAMVVATADEIAPPKPWERTASLGLSLTAGNSDSVLMTAGLEAHGAWPIDDWLIDLDGAYGKTDGDKSNEKLHGNVQYKRSLDTRWYVTGVVDGLHDGVASLAYRATFGPGIGYYFIRAERTSLSADIGPSYVLEKFNGQSTDDYFALRIGERFQHRFSAGARLWQSLEYLPAVDDFQNYKLRAEIGLEAALTDTISLRVVGRDQYNNRPASGREHNDISLTSSIAYKF